MAHDFNPTWKKHRSIPSIDQLLTLLIDPNGIDGEVGLMKSGRIVLNEGIARTEVRTVIGEDGSRPIPAESEVDDDLKVPKVRIRTVAAQLKVRVRSTPRVRVRVP